MAPKTPLRPVAVTTCPRPAGCLGIGAVAVGSPPKFYIMGGWSEGNGKRDDFWVYDTASHRWTKLVAWPGGPIETASLIEHEGNIYGFGGKLARDQSTACLATCACTWQEPKCRRTCTCACACTRAHGRRACECVHAHASADGRADACMFARSHIATAGWIDSEDGEDEPNTATYVYNIQAGTWKQVAINQPSRGCPCGECSDEDMAEKMLELDTEG